MKPPIKKDTHPLAVNVRKFQRYNFNFFSCEEVVFFEYIMVKGWSFQDINQFYHSSETIRKETGIKKHSLKSIIKRFQDLRILEVEVKGMPRVKHFRVNYPRVIELLSQIYQSAENGKLEAGFRELLFGFFKPLADNYQKKNTIQNNREETKKENTDMGSDWDSTCGAFFHFLSSVHYEMQVPENKLKVDENKLFAACKIYGADHVMFYLKKYFTEKGAGGAVSDFFRADRLDSSKLVYIEQQRANEKQHLETFMQSLDDLFNSRREMAGNKKRKFSKTKLVFNHASKKLLADALKEKSELEIRHAFIVYCDQVLDGTLTPQKFLPYFFSRQFGEYGVINTCLEYFNSHYSITSN